MIITHMMVMCIFRLKDTIGNDTILLTNPTMLPSKKFFKEHVLEEFEKRTEDNVFASTVSNSGQEYVSDLLDEHFPKKKLFRF